MNNTEIEYDMDFDKYLLADGISNSKLGLAKRSPAHFQVGFANEGSPALRFGRLLHGFVLEPRSLFKSMTAMPDFSSSPDNVTASGERSWSASTKFVKEMTEQFKKLHHGMEIVTQEHFAKMYGIVSSLHDNAVVRDLMRLGKPEVSLFWNDPSSRMRCKARVDWLRHDERSNECVIVDLKTTADANEFEKSIARYGYPCQMAMYRRGVEAVLGVRAMPWIIAVETTAPFGVRVAPVSEEALEHGDREVTELLALISDCQASGEWPGYTSPSSWELPTWYAKKSDDVELIIEGEVLTV